MSQQNATTTARDGFTFYRSFAEAINLLPEEEQLAVFRMIVQYSLDGTEPNEEAMSTYGLVIWKMMRPHLASDRRRYNNGKRGGAPKGTVNNPKGNNQHSAKPNNREDNREDNQKDNRVDNREDNQRKSNVNVNVNKNVNDNVNENENVNVNVNDNKVVRKAPQGVSFTPPSLGEIESYISKMGYEEIDAQRFYDYYQAVGWRVGNTSMQDWRAAIRRWHTTPNNTSSNLKILKHNDQSELKRNSANNPRFFRNLEDEDYLRDT